MICSKGSLESKETKSFGFSSEKLTKKEKKSHFNDDVSSTLKTYLLTTPHY